MAVERGYERQVAPKPLAAGPQASADDFGAGIGRAVENIGQSVHQAQIRSYQLDRKEKAQQESADFMRAFAETRQGMDVLSGQLRDSADPGGAGHTQKVKTWIDGQREGLLANITDTEVLRQASAQLDEYETRALDGEATWERGQRTAKQLMDAKTAFDTSDNRIQQNPASYAEETLYKQRFLDSMDLEPNVRDKVAREMIDQGSAIALLNGMASSDPRRGLAMLDAGTFNSQLTNPQLNAARSGFEVEIRRQDAAAQHAANVQASAAREQVATLRQLQGRGVDVTAQAQELIPQFQAIGDTSTVAEIQGWIADKAFTDTYRGQTPVQIQGAISRLTAIEKPSATQQAELHWLETHRGGITERYNSDPTGFMVENAAPGQQPPPLAQGMAAREEWWRGMNPVTPVNIFTAAEARELNKQVTEGSSQDYLNVVNGLAEMSPTAAKKAARQIAPDDAQMRELVTLPESYRGPAVNGRAVRAAKPKLIDPSDSDKPEIDKLTRGFENALASMPVASRNAKLETAKNIAAYYLDRRGGTLTTELWGQVLNMAVGGIGTDAQRTGGFGNWSGRSFLIPDGMNASQFARQVFDWTLANPKTAPKNADGSPIDLKLARPVLAPQLPDAPSDGAYNFYIGNRIVTGPDGKPWRFIPRPPR